MTELVNPPVLVGFPGTTVYNATPAAAFAWYDVDLSAIIGGGRRAFGYLKVVKDATADASLFTRENGIDDGGVSTHSPNGCTLPASSMGTVLFKTDVNGIFEIAFSTTTSAWVITLEAFIHA